MYRLTKRKGRKVQISYDGKTWTSTGFDTKEEAERWLQDNHDRKLKDYAKDFFTRTDERSYTYRKKERNKETVDGTVKNKIGYFNNYIMPRWGEYYLSEIKAKEIDRWFLTLKSVRLGTLLSSSVRNYLVSILAQILDLAVSDGILETNEARKVEPVAVRTSRVHGSLSLEELDILFPKDDIDLMEVYKTKSAATFFLIFKDTGFRPGEILALKHEDIRPDGSVYTDRIFDYHTQRIEQRVKTTKTGQKYRIGFLSEQTLRFIGSGNGYIFNYLDSDQDNYNYLFKKIVRKLLHRTDVTQYSLRHAFMTNLINKYPKELIMELMGHKQWESCYDDRTPEQVLDSIRTELSHYQV